MKPVICLWHDSERQAEAWTELSELNFKLTPVHTAGFLLQEHENHIVIAQSVDEKVIEGKNGEVLFAINIPRSAIISLRNLE